MDSDNLIGQIETPTEKKSGHFLPIDQIREGFRRPACSVNSIYDRITGDHLEFIFTSAKPEPQDGDGGMTWRRTVKDRTETRRRKTTALPPHARSPNSRFGSDTANMSAAVLQSLRKSVLRAWYLYTAQPSRFITTSKDREVIGAMLTVGRYPLPFQFAVHAGAAQCWCRWKSLKMPNSEQVSRTW